MMLAKTYNPAIAFRDGPCMVSEKLDGVACILLKTDDGWRSMSRQGKPLPSTAWICAEADKHFPKAQTGTELIGELMVPGMSFKDAGGVIRRDAPDERVELNVWDIRIPKQHQATFRERMFFWGTMYGKTNPRPKLIKLVPAKMVLTDEGVRDEYGRMVDRDPHVEGVMVRPLDGEHSTYRIGRSWGLQRLKAEETADVQVVGFEEATAADDGRPLGMVGRILVRSGSTICGVGPGTLSHDERKSLWAQFGGDKTIAVPVAEVKYKPDPTYKGLREGRFYRWREDKQ